MPLRGGASSHFVLLAMTVYAGKVERAAVEGNNPEPFLMKRPTPPKEGNKVGLCFEGSDAVQGG